MAVVTDTIWAIDLGNNSLKALRLTAARGVVEVVGFDNIEHGKILTGSGIKPVERDELIAITLRQFLQRNDLSNSEIIISVPSQNSFARFVNLPPVEAKRIPEIVKFEAVQQIPFDINDVQWDWQMMTGADSPEKKVGLFAIKNEAIDSILEHFNRENLQVSYVQMTPMALYNYVLHDYADLLVSDNQAIIVVNIGAENTDLVVCSKSIVWQRCILIGGNTFTKAIADAFKLNFEKAEKLKRTAPVSKYARQILQAMKPVFTDLVSEVQRSLGFYNSAHANTKFLKVVALGGGTKLRGLLKYLQQSLQMTIERPDSFKRLTISSGVSAAKFHESVSDLGITYGLGLQGLGLAKITCNMLPKSVARSMAWVSKGRYFTIAACLLLLFSLMALARTALDKVNYTRNSQIRQEVSQILDTARQARNELQAQESRGSESQAKIKREFEPFKYRQIVPLLHEMLLSALPNAKNNPVQKELYEAFVKGDVETVKLTPRKERKQLFVASMSVFFTDDLAKAQFGSTAMMRRSTMGLAQQGMSEGYMDYGMREEMMGIGGYRDMYSPFPEGQAAAPEKKAGFVVTISGYSPYANISELLDPAGVANEPNKWGFVTRLMHPIKAGLIRPVDVVDGNSPFQLYDRTSVEHFRLDTGTVDLASETLPAGIGVIDYVPVSAGQTATSGDTMAKILIDPMTKELINTVPELDQYGREKLDSRGRPSYQKNDCWFILNVKFEWKGAPKLTEQTTGASSTVVTPQPARPAPAPSKGKELGGFGDI
jgi:type IV pilus assembly protein PilM